MVIGRGRGGAWAAAAEMQQNGEHGTNQQKVGMGTTWEWPWSSSVMHGCVRSPSKPLSSSSHYVSDPLPESFMEPVFPPLIAAPLSKLQRE